ncbi:MAG: hypothetical protein KKG95_00285, partial [Candidatus Omnitrophica bacterium]|nr:hypothetical protein [Candidatus Omnitrophota bacterium]MBU1783765.1 hypothetical protein [Candidatus Omnitrophota bacterium]
YITVTSGTDSGNNINWFFKGSGESISGTVYLDEGVTVVDIDTELILYLYYATGSTSISSAVIASAGDGTYTFSNLDLDEADIATIYMEDSFYEGCVISRLNGVSVSGVDLYAGDIIIRSETAQAITNLDLNNADNGDNDIKYNVSGNNLSIDSGFKLLVWNNDAFAPGGNITADNFENEGVMDIDADIAIDIDGDFTNTGTIDLTGTSSTINVAGDWNSSSGTFIPGTSTVTFDGSGGQAITGANTFYNLTIANTAPIPTDAADVDPDSIQTVTNLLSVNDGQWSPHTGDEYRSVTIAAQGIIRPDSGASITVSGDWSNSGTFTHNDGEVVFDGDDQTISGSTTFYNLTRTHSSSMTFEEGKTQSIGGNLTLQGTGSSDLLELKSSISGRPWYIDIISDSYSLNHIDVHDSWNIGPEIIYVVAPSSNILDAFSADHRWAYVWQQEPPRPPDPPEPPNIDLPEPDINPPEPDMDSTGLVNIADDDERWKKKRAKSRYRTVVIVFEGKVVVAPYDEKGIKHEEEVSVNAGETLTVTGECAPGFDYESFFETTSKTDTEKHKRKYIAGRYRTIVDVLRGEPARVIPCDKRGVRYEEAVVVAPGERVIQEGKIENKP